MSLPAAARFKRPRPSYLDDAVTVLQHLPPSAADEEDPASLYDRAVALAEATQQHTSIPALDAVHAARSARSPDVVDAVGIATDAASVAVLVQSIRGNGGLVDGPFRKPPMMPCAPDTLWLWTKYFKQVTVAATENKAGGSMMIKIKKEKSTPSHRTIKRQKMMLALSTRSARMPPTATKKQASTTTTTLFDLLSSVASCPDLVFHVCSYLQPADVFMLYRVSRVFKATVDAEQSSNNGRLGRLFAPESAAVFPWDLYHGRGEPSIRYVGMLISRDRKVRDIIACLARSGQRLPQPGASVALKKTWLLMDAATNRGRHALLQQVFSDSDLLMLQMFCTKLALHLQEPLFAVPGRALGGGGGGGGGDGVTPATPISRSLAEVLLGQRGGLHVLWLMLRGRAFATSREAIELKVRYDYLPPVLPEFMTMGGPHGHGEHNHHGQANFNTIVLDHNGFPHVLSLADAGGTSADLPHADMTPFVALMTTIHAVPLWEMGVGHLEGWGLGTQHLLRPDELVPLEAARRGLDLRPHLPFLAVWGCRDFETGANLVPTLDEIYMSDEEQGSSDDDSSATRDREQARQKEAPRDELVVTLNHRRHDLLTAQARLRRLGGNVPCVPGEWQPWQVLKARWGELSAYEKLDIWWVCQQERLKAQAWMHDAAHGRDEDGEGDGAGGRLTEGMSDTDTEPDGNNEEDEAAEEGQDKGQADEAALVVNGEDGPKSLMSDIESDADSDSGSDSDTDTDTDTDSDMFVLDDDDNDDDGHEHNSAGESGGIHYRRRLRHRRHRRRRAGPPGGVQGGVQGSLRVSSGGTTASSSRSFSLHHRRLMAACVETALQQQLVADAELVAQADEPYEEDELEWWEQVLDTMLAAEDEQMNGEVEDEGEDEGEGEDEDEDENEDEDEGEDEDKHEDEHEGQDKLNQTAAAADNAVDNNNNNNNDNDNDNDNDNAVHPDVVQTRHYGDDEDVLELLDELATAETAVTTASPATVAAAMTHAASLRDILDARMKAEVFALDFGEM